MSRLVIEAVKKVSQKAKVKDWYIENFPDDDLGERLNPKVTFQDVWKTLEEDGSRVYKTLGAGDSVIRERVFTCLAQVYKVSYDTVYDMWLNNDKAQYDVNVFIKDVDKYINMWKRGLSTYEDLVKKLKELVNKL